MIIFHGTADTLVSIEYSKRLCKCYKNASLIPFEGEEHGFTEPFITKMAEICTSRMLDIPMGVSADDAH